MRSDRKTVDGNLMLITAKKLIIKLGLEGEVNESWIHRWRQRNGIRTLKLHGDAADCPDFGDWMQRNRDVLEAYDESHIINLDETALFWRMESNKTFVSITEDTANLRGRKINRSRVTILTGVKADGTRLPLWCIGTAACPRWPKPKNSKMEAKQPPLQYLSSKKGWMTTTLFAQILADLEKKFSKSKSKILLILDNCPAHCDFEEEYDGEKTFINVLMLPKNITSNLQPCDAGVIRSMKAHYNARLTRFLVYKEAKDVSLYEGLLMLRAAWEEVSSDVVRNAWGARLA